MNLPEAGELLAIIAGYDHRTVGDVNILAWQAALSDVDFGAARAAVLAHYREHTDWLMPAHVRHGVEQAERERREAERERREAEFFEQQLERAITAGQGNDRSAAVREIIAQVRGALPAGRPDSLRYGHARWRDAWELEQRQRTAEPSPPLEPERVAALGFCVECYHNGRTTLAAGCITHTKAAPDFTEGPST